MIIKTERGYLVYSTDGLKRLGGPYPTKSEALAQHRVTTPVPEGGTYGGKGDP